LAVLVAGPQEQVAQAPVAAARMLVATAQVRQKSVDESSWRRPEPVPARAPLRQAPVGAPLPGL
jgi:hypothetical protein